MSRAFLVIAYGRSMNFEQNELIFQCIYIVYKYLEQLIIFLKRGYMYPTVRIKHIVCENMHTL